MDGARPATSDRTVEPLHDLDALRDVAAAVVASASQGGG